MWIDRSLQFRQMKFGTSVRLAVRYGPLTLDVPPGKFRNLTAQEVDRLRTAYRSEMAGRKRSVS